MAPSAAPSSPRRQRRLALLLAVPAVLFGATAIARFLNGKAGIDLIHYDQGLWLASRGHSPASTVLGEGLLADHFGPAILLFAPLYRIVASPIWLLVAQVVAVWASVWQISRQLLPRLGLRRASLVGVAVFCSPPVAFAVLFDVHSVVFAIPFALAAVFSIQEDRPWRALAFGLIAATFRADIAYGVLAAFLILPGRRRRRLRPFGILLAYVGIATYLEFGLGRSGTAAWLAYWGHLGSSPLDALLHPWRMAPAVLTPRTGLKALPWLATGGFLCFLASPRLMAPAIAVGLPTLLSQWPGSYAWALHYGIATTLLLAPAWIAVLQRRPDLTRFVFYGVLFLNVIGGPFVPYAFELVDIRTSSLVDTRTNSLSSHWTNDTKAACIVNGIPASATVSAVAHPASLLGHRTLLFVWPHPFYGQNDIPSLSERRPDLAARVDYVIRDRTSPLPVPPGFVWDGVAGRYERFRREATTDANIPTCA